MEGVLALLIPVVAVGGFFTWMLALSPVGKAYAERIRSQTRAGPDPALPADQVVQELADLQRQVTELQERVDFAERLLARQREQPRVEPPR